jgi:hypothetical protein
MTHPSSATRRAALALRAMLLLATLLLGAAFHGLHHLQDPGCGAGNGRTSHECVACAGLHSSTLLAATTIAPAPTPSRWVLPAPRLVATPSFAPHRAASPRAPPES